MESGRGRSGNPGNRRPGAKQGGGARPFGPARSSEGQRPRRTGGIGLRHLGGNAYELIHPRCVEELRPDYEEGLEMWRAGEPEEARDALRYALQGCGDNLWVHVALGRIALEANRDPSLARGHFGYAFELARKAVTADFVGTLPPGRPANQPFYDAIDGLIACYEALGQHREAADLRGMAAAWTGERAH